MIKTEANNLCSLVYTVSLAILLSGGARAQQPSTEANADADEESIEEIFVTGSRVRQNPLEARNPVQVFTFDDFLESGDVSFYDYLQRIPANGSALNRTNNTSGVVGTPADGSGAGAGAIEIDLRYLESKRTLVLVDGRRWIRGSSASGVSGAIDLNTIPHNAIKSVEVLLDGASAIYGSDAIGGVVNIITKDDYDGMQFSAYYSQFGESGGGDNLSLDASLGVNSERGRVFVGINYVEQQGVMGPAREITRYPIPGYQAGASIFTPQGVFFFTNELSNFAGIILNEGVVNSGASNGGLPIYDPANPASGDYHGWGTNNLVDRFNWQTTTSALMPNDRVSALVKGEYDLTDSVVANFMASFTNRQSRSQAAAVPIGLGNGAGFNPFLRNVVIPADQEYNPFGIQLGGAGGFGFSAFLRPVEAGPRIYEQNVDTWHVYMGLEGEFTAGDRDWYWDVNSGWFQSDAGQLGFNIFNGRDTALALGPAADCAAVPDCVPLNIFGGQGGMSRDQLDFVTFIQKDSSLQELFDVSANISGSLFELPAGAVGVAGGFAYREEKASFVPDSAASSVSRATPINGSFDVLEFYAEAVVPVFSEFDLSAAIRSSDYNLFGSDSVVSFGLKWSPLEVLTLRASYNEGFRAPNIGEHFNPAIVSDAQIVDPCSGATGQTATNCQALGVPPGYISPGVQFPVASGGNPTLQPEESESYTVGFTWDASGPLGAERFLVGLNYYDIQLDNSVFTPNAQIILEQCVATADPRICGLVTRDPTGLITLVDATINNIAGLDTNGIDLEIGYSTREYNFGQLHFDWVSNFLIEYTEKNLDANGNIILTPREGTELGESGRGFPEFKSILTARLDKNNWSAGLTLSYVDGLTERCGGLTRSFGFLPGVLDQCDSPTATPSDPEGTNSIDDKLYVDIQASFRPEWFDGATDFSIGVQNVTDEDPPPCQSCRINGFNGMLYRFPGQVFYARATYNSD
jgi:iron complex outermembrane receptor protein